MAAHPIHAGSNGTHLLNRIRTCSFVSRPDKSPSNTNARRSTIGTGGNFLVADSYVYSSIAQIFVFAQVSLAGSGTDPSPRRLYAICVYYPTSVFIVQYAICVQLRARCCVCAKQDHLYKLAQSSKKRSTRFPLGRRTYLASGVIRHWNPPFSSISFNAEYLSPMQAAHRTTAPAGIVYWFRYGSLGLMTVRCEK